MFLSDLRIASMIRRPFNSNARSWLPVVMGLLLVVAAVGCYDSASGDASLTDAIEFTLPAFPETGSNAVQLFTEMHYQPSYRSQEEPRLLPPEGSVPITGAEIVYTSLDDYNAAPTKAGDAVAGQGLYSINCLVCHGAALDGNGPILAYNYSGVFPADLRATPSTDNELFAFISGGGSMGLSMRMLGRASSSPMPEFRLLLTEQERWDIVAYLKGQ
jgi:mono/diheme cytochrome c family protein